MSDRILDCILLIRKSGLGFSSVNFSSLNLIKMNLINFTGLSKHFSYLRMRKQASGNYLRCVIDRTMRDGQYKCHHVRINLVDFFFFFHVSLTLITHCVFYMKKNVHVYTLNITLNVMFDTTWQEIYKSTRTASWIFTSPHPFLSLRWYVSIKLQIHVVNNFIICF